MIELNKVCKIIDKYDSKFRKKDQKINVFINNHPEWGGTFQYTQLIIKLLKKNL